ncbi:ShKT domain-containing protein [Aphelenchoides besseyi]|nr:ShKT domain-containing protein [Aphelenchoides besseyi]
MPFGQLNFTVFHFDLLKLLILILMISVLLTQVHTSASTCKDVLSDCEDSIAFCRRPGYVNFMRRNCRRSCRFCRRSTPSTRKKPKRRPNRNCRDVGSNCRQNKSYCDQPLYAKVLRENCLRTCGYCKYAGYRVKRPPRLPAGCVDRNAACVNWGQHGFCTSRYYSQAVKETECARTCRMC